MDFTLYKEAFDTCASCHGEGAHFDAAGPLKDGNIPGVWTACDACEGTGGTEREMTDGERIAQLEKLVEALIEERS
tara:strand:- start:226 stop:453 length:228 start_codon:yes stop_codon:yes gene_type:complete